MEYYPRSDTQNWVSPCSVEFAPYRNSCYWFVCLLDILSFVFLSFSFVCFVVIVVVHLFFGVVVVLSKLHLSQAGLKLSMQLEDSDSGRQDSKYAISVQPIFNSERLGSMHICVLCVSSSVSISPPKSLSPDGLTRK